jgi:hypothetical protein
MGADIRYSREDLLDAWMAPEGSRSLHPVIADHYYRRARAMANAFGAWGPGIHFSECPKEHKQLWTVFKSTVDACNRSRRPWGHFLAGGPTPELAEVEERHRPPIKAADEALTAAYCDLLIDLIERIWGIGPDRGIPREALRKRGSVPTRRRRTLISTGDPRSRPPPATRSWRR